MSEAHRLPDHITEHPDGALVHVYVQPKAATSGIVGVHGGALKVKVTAPPLDDRETRP